MTRRDSDEIGYDEDGEACEVSEAALEQPFPIGDLLRADLQSELDRRGGSWDAFSTQVLRRIESESSQEAQRALDAQAIAVMKRRVESEVAESLPRFEREFRTGVEARIWQAAKRPTFAEHLERLWADFLDMAQVKRAGVLAGVATLALGVIWVRHDEMNHQPTALAQSGGRVSVEQVTFEGTVTVMNDEETTIVWLDDSTT